MQYFDLSCVAFEDLPYVTLLCRLLKQLPTREHSAEELDNLLAGKLGFLSFTTEVMTQPEVDGVRPYLLVSAGALSEKIDALASLPREVWSSTLLADADADRMRDVLTQIRIGLEQGFINNGHSAALGRAMSYSSPSAVVREQLSGVDFYLFLRDLLNHFDERLTACAPSLPSWRAASLWPTAAWRALPAATRTLTRTGMPRATWGWVQAMVPAATRSRCRRRATATRLS